MWLLAQVCVVVGVVVIVVAVVSVAVVVVVAAAVIVVSESSGDQSQWRYRRGAGFLQRRNFVTTTLRAQETDEVIASRQRCSFTDMKVVVARAGGSQRKSIGSYHILTCLTACTHYIIHDKKLFSLNYVHNILGRRSGSLSTCGVTFFTVN